MNDFMEDIEEVSPDTKELIIRNVERDKKYEKLKPVGSVKRKTVDELLKKQKEAEGKKYHRFLTGDFQKFIGFPTGEISVIGGKTNAGKTTTLANFAVSAFNQRLKTLVITLEDDTSNFFDIFPRVYREKVVQLEDKIQAIEETYDKITILDDPELLDHRVTLETIRNYLKEEHYDLVLIDYYQKMQGECNPPNANLKSFTRDFHSLVKQHGRDTAFIIWTQLNRKKDVWETRFQAESKDLPNACRVFIEIIMRKATYETDFIVWKGKASNANMIEKKITLGFHKDKMKYVINDDDFIKECEAWEDDTSHLSDVNDDGESTLSTDNKKLLDNLIKEI